MNRAMEATIVANHVTNNQTRVADLTRRIEKLEQQRIQAETALEYPPGATRCMWRPPARGRNATSRDTGDGRDGQRWDG